MKSIYLIGSLRNPAIPELANELRGLGFDVFDDWFAAGRIADDSWQEYSNLRGMSYAEALESYSACHVYEFDKKHIDRCDIAILLLPAGKSGHLELGHMNGTGKLSFILFDKTPERYDVMYKLLSGGVYFDKNALFERLRKELPQDDIPF
jgi:hypothetical protein